ncbi:MAG: hypothetical protein Q9178_006456 [Gyalolechia marmorata]
MNELRIHTQIHSRYQVFDASGQLPFSLVFGLCRRSPDDTDPRPLSLEIAGSILDIPHALKYGLLTLHQQDSEDAKQWIEVDLSQLNRVAAKGTECLSLPSPVNRTEHWRDAFTVYQCPIDVNGELASILEPGKRYSIRLASEDLGVKRWAYSDREKFVDDDTKPSHDSEAVKLVNSKATAGNATFEVEKSLPCPPKLETRMRLSACSQTSDSAPANAKLSGSNDLEVSVVNNSSDSITIQTRGHQRFLIPWGPYQPEPEAVDDRMRIIHETPHKPPTSSLQVVDSATREVVRGNKQRGTGPLTDSNADRGPKVEDVVTLKPGVPAVRKIDIGTLVHGLVDGQYKIRMQSRGCRWWNGEVGEKEAEDWRMPAHLCRSIVSPGLSTDEEQHVRSHALHFSTITLIFLCPGGAAARHSGEDLLPRSNYGVVKRLLSSTKPNWASVSLIWSADNLPSAKDCGPRQVNDTFEMSTPQEHIVRGFYTDYGRPWGKRFFDRSSVFRAIFKSQSTIHKTPEAICGIDFWTGTRRDNGGAIELSLSESEAPRNRKRAPLKILLRVLLLGVSYFGILACNCGIYHATNKFEEASVKITGSNAELESGALAEKCFNTDAGTDGCNFFLQQSIPYQVSSASCPFRDATMCSIPDSSVVRFSTGSVDVHVIGLAAAKILEAGYSHKIAEDQWKKEARQLFETSLTRIQISARDFALGVGAKYGLQRIEQGRKELCDRTFLFKSQGWQNVHVAGSAWVVLWSVVVVLMAVPLDDERLLIEPVWQALHPLFEFIKDIL